MPRKKASESGSTSQQSKRTRGKERVLEDEKRAKERATLVARRRGRRK